jgi:hypothetical protein
MHIQQVKLEADEEDAWEIMMIYPIAEKNLQLRRLHEQSQPLEQLDEVIEKIRELMIRSAETASKEKLSRKRSSSNSSSSSSNSRGDGADEQLQKFVWDPGGFPQLRVEAHEQELMNFAAEEYDAGASLHVSQPASQPRQRMHSRLKRGATLISILNLNVIKCFRLLSHEAVLCTGIE